MHLISDMAVPAHVRNDAHIPMPTYGTLWNILRMPVQLAPSARLDKHIRPQPISVIITLLTQMAVKISEHYLKV